MNYILRLLERICRIFSCLSGFCSRINAGHGGWRRAGPVSNTVPEGSTPWQADETTDGRSVGRGGQKQKQCRLDGMRPSD